MATPQRPDRPFFRFSPNAYQLDLFLPADGVCDACGEARSLKYDAGFYSRDEPAYICAWCVADGTAALKFDGQFNDFSAIDGIGYAPRVWTVDPRDAEEVSLRTPSYPSWQQEEWRSHCGRPCAFIGFVGAHELPFYERESDFAADVNGGLEWDPELLRRRLRRHGDLAGYLFQCIQCGAHRLHVDAS